MAKNWPSTESGDKNTTPWTANFATVSLAGSNVHHSISDFPTRHFCSHVTTPCSTGKCPVQHKRLDRRLCNSLGRDTCILRPRRLCRIPGARTLNVMFPRMILELRHVSSNQSSRSRGHYFAASGSWSSREMPMCEGISSWKLGGRPGSGSALDRGRIPSLPPNFLLGHCHG